ncbi:metabotropic glutamate receptor 1-like [Rhopilema esculentum]|uniref:metabotropic glutamate receptor 1-like n=1 Tax=Rhopilema esculentum TaxID=499914 RepID=UPI0031D8BC8A
MLGVGPMQFEDEWFRHELIKATNGSSLPWAKSFNCFEESFCERQKLSECVVGRHYEVSPFVAPTFDAVYAVASALHKQLHCSEQNCHVLRSRNGDLVDYLRHITFTGISGRNISFDGEGTASRSYQVVSFQRTTSALNLVRIANWTLHPTGNSSIGRFHLITQVKWDSVVAPGSNCSRNCAPGEYKTPQKLHPNCCWNCVKCGGGTITKYMNAKKCSICPRGFSPNDNRTDCIPIHDVFIEWNGGISIAIVTLSSICIAVVILTYVVFALFKDTPIVKAARHSLCYMQLLGVICFEILPFVFIGKPRAINCDLKPFLIGFCLSFNIGTIFVKTNKTARSFNEKAFETNGSILKRQVVIVVLIIALEELICLVWILTMDRPHLKKVMLSPRESCQACMYGNSSKGVALWCSYNAGLILVTTYQAILVRKAKCNYNESKFLLFTMVSWCVTILVYIPVFVGINGYIKDIIMSFLLIFMGMIEYICVFVPKLYIIIFRPHKNVSK